MIQRFRSDDQSTIQPPRSPTGNCRSNFQTGSTALAAATLLVTLCLGPVASCSFRTLHPRTPSNKRNKTERRSKWTRIRLRGITHHLNCNGLKHTIPSSRVMKVWRYCKGKAMACRSQRVWRRHVETGGAKILGLNLAPSKRQCHPHPTTALHCPTPCLAQLQNE